MRSDSPADPLRVVLDGLARDLDGARLRLPTPVLHEREAMRTAVVAGIRNYLVPRLSGSPAPLVVAVTGPGGAGTSTIVNAIAGQDVSTVGVVRPTSTRPLVWSDGTPEGRWWTDLVGRLGGSVAVDAHASGGSEGPGLVLIDVPAAVGANDVVRIAAITDVCIFVTSPARYADATAASLLAALKTHGVAVLNVINRLPADETVAAELTDAYVSLLHDWGIVAHADPYLVFGIPDTNQGDLVPAIARLRRELALLDDPEFLRLFVWSIVKDRVRATTKTASLVADALEEERDAFIEYGAIVRAAYRHQLDRLDKDLHEGRFTALAAHSSWGQAAVDLTGIVTRRAGLAAQDASEAWSDHPEGAAFLSAGGGGLRRHGKATTLETQALLDSWLGELGAIAAARTRRGTAGRRRRRRLADSLWPSVLDPDRSSPSARRVLRDAHDDVVAEARTRLIEDLRIALDRDAERFDRFLGSVIDAGLIGRVRASARDALAEAEAADALAALESEVVADPDLDEEPESAQTSDASDSTDTEMRAPDA